MRLIWGHSLAHFLSPVDMSSEGIHICLALVSTALLGVCRRCGFSSHNIYTCLLAHLVLYNWVVLFYKVYPQTLDICLIWILSRVQSGQSLEGSIRYLGPFSCSTSLTFSEGVPKLSENISNISCAIWIVCPVQYPRGSLLLSPGL